MMNDALAKALAYIAARCREPSTYPSIMLIAGAIGHWATADAVTKQQAVMDICVGIAGLIGAVLPDRMTKNTRADDKPEVQPPKE